MDIKFKDKLTSLILEEIAERIQKNDTIKEYLKEFLDFPPEKVATELLAGFEKFLTSNLTQEIIARLKESDQPIVEGEELNVSQEGVPQISKEEPLTQEESLSETSTDQTVEIRESETQISAPEPDIIDIPISHDIEDTAEKPSVYFRKEKRTDIKIAPDDWIYLYGFSYAPNSEGKGFPSIELPYKGVDNNNVVFGLDYGDVRLFMSKLEFEKYTIAKTGVFILKPDESIQLRYNHTRILNNLRNNEIIVPLEFWTLKKGRESIINIVEERYLDFLHSLIDVHDAVDWDVEASVLDTEILKLTEPPALNRTWDSRYESRRQSKPRVEIKQYEKVLFKEKEIAQKINLGLTKIANKIKIDYIVTLDSSFLDGWKPILSARYVIGKEKRKSFHQKILDFQNELSEYKVMISVSSPKVKFKF